MAERRAIWPARVALLVLAVSPGLCMADAPKIDRVFPQGGQMGTTVELTLSGKAGGSLKGWSDCGIQFEFSEKFDKARLSIPKSAPVGLRLIRFYNAEGASRVFPFVVSRMVESNEKEPNDRVTTAGRLAAGGVYNGVLSRSGDVDTCAIALKRGQTLVASVAAHRLGSPMDGVLQLLDARGTVLLQNDEWHGFDPQIVYPVPKDGEYLVRVFAFPATPNSTIRFAGGSTYAYRLTMTTGPFLDHALPMVVNDKTARLELVGWNLNEDAKGVLERTADADRVRVVSPADNNLELERVAHQSLIEAAVDDSPASIPFSLTGVVSAPGEVDKLLVAGKKGTVQIRVAAQSLHSALDPVVAIRTTNGKLVKEFDDISRADRDIRASVNLPGDGEYTIEVRDRFGHGGRRYVYAITCSRPAPGFRVTSAADAFVVAPGKSLEIPLTITRSNGFSESITLQAVGLPDSISCKAVTSEPKGDSSKAVTLVITSQAKQAVAGEFSIECRTGAAGTRTVVREFPEFGSRVDRFWLTAPAGK